MSKQEILDQFGLFNVPGGGIGNWLTDSTDDMIFERLERLPEDPLSNTQFNQLLVLSREAPVSDGFFGYYWLEAPEEHPYAIQDVTGFSANELEGVHHIKSLPHLEWVYAVCTPMHYSILAMFARHFEPSELTTMSSCPNFSLVSALIQKQ